ncbi:hypothetical protein BV20DRAFT_976760 [Pilatotrama ljubarskyi]|nr:hypothetical protein BV20DRAFT_976760 [Pilatotrama ljubarskyi]
MFSSLLGLTLLALPFAAVASTHGPAHHRRHEAIAAHVNTTEAQANTTQLHRRGQTFTGARLTYYDVGMGACGKKNVPSDFIVALNGDSYGDQYPGPNCFRPIEITYNGKTAKATIMDKCPGCPSPGGLDLSTGLFSYLAPLDEGVLYASWRYLDEGDDPAPEPTTSKWEPPTTSWWQPPTTTTKAHKTTSSTWSPPPSPTSTWSSSSEWSTSSTPTTSSTPSSSSAAPTSSSVASSSASPSSSVAPAALATPAGPDTLGKLNQAFLGLAELMIAGAEAN